MKMMKNLLLRDKEGVSLMIGYVLLVIIAIGLSVVVYTFLKLYIPPGSPECPEDVKLTIEEVTCVPAGSDEYNVQVTLTNRGLFKVYGVYIRLGEPGKIHKELLNPGNDLYFIGTLGKPYLMPGETIQMGQPEYQYTPTDGGTKELEIEPIYIGEGKDAQAAVCENAFVSKNIICS